MGGTPECYGWLTWVRTPNLHAADEPGIADDKFTTAYHYYQMDHAKGQWAQMGLSSLDLSVVKWNDNMDHPWLLAGAEQLGIIFVPTEEYEAMVAAEAQ